MEVEQEADDDMEGAERVENEENEAVPKKKFVTTEQMSTFIQSHSSQKEGLEWVLFLPSKDHSPLTLRDKKSGSNGRSIILSGSKPVGMSLVQIDYDLRNALMLLEHGYDNHRVLSGSCLVGTMLVQEHLALTLPCPICIQIVLLSS